MDFTENGKDSCCNKTKQNEHSDKVENYPNRQQAEKTPDSEKEVHSGNNHEREIRHEHEHEHEHGHEHEHEHGHEHEHEHEHGHGHGIGHHHHHHHQQDFSNLNRAFKIGITINLIYVATEAVCGLIFNSMGLLSDAGHNLTDVASLAFALIAYKLAARSASSNYTYGYKKSTILISLLNGIILLAAVAFIIAESIEKLIHPLPLQGGVISIIAAIGVIVNGFTTFLFLKNSKEDLNVKGAYLHMLADTMVSVGVVIAGIIIHFTGWYAIDGIIGLAVAIIIVIATWKLLSESIRLALDGIPHNLDSSKIISIFKETQGILEMHHLHIWALSTTENALTAHVVIQDINEMENIKTILKEKLQKSGISHATLEFETTESLCDGKC